MPCYEPDRPSYYDEVGNRLEASLCAVLSEIEVRGNVEAFLSTINWAEAGVTRDWVYGWWREHQAKDARRRAEERARQERIEAVNAALSKLTPEERELLRNAR